MSTPIAGTTTAGNTSTGVAGYSIAGETHPSEPGQEYRYTHMMPDGGEGVYWYVKGAVTIDGAPVNVNPSGRLNANEHPALTIKWNLSGQEGLVLQLRRDNSESEAGVDVLADLFGRGTSFCTGHIEYYGPTSSQTSSGVRSDQFLCVPLPNVPAPSLPPVLKYHFTYESPNCDYFIWTMRYHTADGSVYVEQWLVNASRTWGDFALYTSVPSNSHAANPTPIDPLTGAPYPSSNQFLPYNPPAGTVVPAGLSGQTVLLVDVQCTGYRTIFCNMSDEMHVYYTGALGNLGPISGAGALTPYCRTQPIALSVSAPAGATTNTRYTWTTQVGTTVSPVAATGNSIALDVSWVPPHRSTITVWVEASDNSCGGTPRVTAAQPVTLQLAAPGLQPQSMLLTNGLCPTIGTNTKTVSVDGQNSALEYKWNISGIGATFFDGNTEALNSPGIQTIVTPSATPVTVTVRRKLNDCGGFGPPLSTTYQIASTAPVAPTGASLVRCLSDGQLYLNLVNVQPGVNYFYSAFSVAPAGSVTFTGGANGIGTTVQLVPDANGVFPTQFIFVVTATSPCSSATPNFGVLLTTPKKGSPCGVVGPKSAAPPVLYPNPTTGQITIAAEPTIVYAWARVMDAQGQMKQEQKANSPQGVTALDVSALPTGIYLVQLFDGQRLTTQRLVKE